MKKNIFRLAVLLMAGSLLVFSCKKNPTPVTPDDKGKEQQGGQEQGGEQGVKPMPIALDGAFADWDAITDAVVSANEYVDAAKGGSSDPITVFKVAADADNIYFYIEFQADLLPQNESSGTWGSSFSENTLIVGEDDDEYREVMHLFIDPDNNSKTGFLTFVDPDSGDPALPTLGCEMCAQYFMYFKPSTGLVSVAFEQTLVGPTKTGTPGDDDQVSGSYTGDFDYNGTICQDDWPDSGDEAAFPLWGWQNPDDSGKGDNDCPVPDDWKPAKVGTNGIAKVEFALMKENIVNLNAEDDEFSCGIIFDWGGVFQKVGPLTVSYVK